MIEKCLNVRMDAFELIESCRQAAERAEEFWRSEGIGELRIDNVLDHQVTGIPPRFADPDKLEEMRQVASEKLGEKVKQIDGVRGDGLVNVLIE